MSQNPAITVLQRERDVVASRIDAIQAEMREARATLRALEEALAQLGGGPVRTPLVVERRAGETLNDQVLDLLRAGTEGHTPTSLADTLTERGRETANTTISSILSRLHRAGLAEKKNGRWFCAEKREPPEGGSDPEEEAGAGVAAPAGPTHASSNPRTGKLLGGTTLSGSFPIQLPLAQEKGG